MKVGDLVVMKDSGYNRRTIVLAADDTIGIVVDDSVIKLLDRAFRGDQQVRGRVGIMWAGGGGIDYEPRDWLEVISETN